ncbi:MAG: FecR domain-containing protein [Thiomicrospira sp.]|uniref:FecR family protein n=1 Tax=Thiomicrospira sp. TaxID=935 RepID=UPI0019DD718A|nr:FecR family protein [Thiomicrospira sp.]MBE0494651.1 FecR domain-containing protein [Thiomicrospira sp.]
MFKRPLLTLIFLMLSFLTLPSFASVGTISLATGEVNIQRAEQTLRAETGAELLAQDKVVTSSGARAQLRFSDQTVITLGSNTEFGIESFLNEGSNRAEAKFNIAKGTFKVITGQIGKAAPDKFSVKTRTATIGIRGTIFSGRIAENRETIATISGRIFVTEDQTGRSVDVPAGQFTNITPGQPPAPPKPLTNQELQELNEDASEQTEGGTTDSSENQASGNDETDNLQNTDGLTEQADPANDGQPNVDTRIVDQSLDSRIEKDLEDQFVSLVDHQADVIDVPVEEIVNDPLPSTLTGWKLLSASSYVLQDPCFDCLQEPSQDDFYLDYEANEVYGGEFETSQLDLVGTFDDNVGWGTWEQDGLAGFWVGGTEATQAAAHINSLINQPVIYSYSGQVLGEVFSYETGQTFSINTASSHVGLSFNFAEQSIAGGMGFSASNGSEWQLTVDPTYQSLNGSLFSSGLRVDGQEYSSGYLEGMVYGSNAESIGGGFWANRADGLIANGVFKAVKQ